MVPSSKNIRWEATWYMNVFLEYGDMDEFSFFQHIHICSLFCKIFYNFINNSFSVQNRKPQYLPLPQEPNLMSEAFYIVESQLKIVFLTEISQKIITNNNKIKHTTH